MGYSCIGLCDHESNSMSRKAFTPGFAGCAVCVKAVTLAKCIHVSKKEIRCYCCGCLVRPKPRRGKAHKLMIETVSRY